MEAANGKNIKKLSRTTPLSRPEARATLGKGQGKGTSRETPLSTTATHDRLDRLERLLELNAENAIATQGMLHQLAATQDALHQRLDQAKATQGLLLQLVDTMDTTGWVVEESSSSA